MMKQLTLLLLILATFSLNATPPEPPVGKRWILNEQFSDEFNGSSIDATKWYDYHPTWVGRSPGIFLSSQVKVANGYMTIQGAKLPKDTMVTNWNGTVTDTFNVACGAVVSRTQDASYGYYETRVKANKTTMSTTFWMSTRKNYDGPETSCNDKYGLELDFQECIGRTGNFSGSWFANGMHSNSHFWYTGCDGIKQDLRATSVDHKVEVLPSDTFYTYGGWWRDANSVSFYFEDSLTGDMRFNTSIKDEPFDQKMGLNMVSETYPYPWIELPNDEELADPTKNTCYYDWVRSYTLVDVNQRTTLPTVKLFPENVWFTNTRDTITNALTIPLTLNFMSNTNRELNLSLIDKNNKVLFDATSSAYAGYGNKAWNISLTEKLTNMETYTAVLAIRATGSSDNSNAYKVAQYQFVVQDPAQVTVIVKDERQDILLDNSTITLGDINSTSNEFGSASFSDVNLGLYDITVARDGYSTSTFENIEITKDTTLTFSISPKNYKASVYVKDSVTHEVIRGAYVFVGSKSYRTGTSGYALITLPYGSNDVTVKASDYPNTTKTINITGTDDYTLYVKKNLTSVKYSVKLDNSYFAGVDISFNNEVKTTSTFGTATFEDIPVLTPLEYFIKKDDKIWHRKTASFYNDSTVNINLSSTALDKISTTELTLFPNPVKDQLIIKGINKTIPYTIYNSLGVVCLKGEYAKLSPINVKHLKGGNTYFIKLGKHTPISFNKE